MTLEEILGRDWPSAVEARRSTIEAKVGERTDVLLFGTGALGRMVHQHLPAPFRAIAFVDNNPRLWGTTVLGLPVVSPEDARSRFGDRALWLITIYTNRSVIDQCRALGVPWATCAELSWLLKEPHSEPFVFGSPEVFTSSARDIERAADCWADGASRTEYLSQVRWRFLLDYEALAEPRPPAETYFPDDLIRPLVNEVFVDCGAFTGDTIDAFLRVRGGQFGRIVAIEPDVANCDRMRERMRADYPQGDDRIRIEPVALGSRSGTLTFHSTGTVRSKVGTGATTVQVATLDDLLAGSGPTYVKFDIEGAEHDALVGGSSVIGADAPVLAVSAYHKSEDLWDLPLLVRSINPDYRLFLRRYSDERWEQVLYAVPPDRVIG